MKYLSIKARIFRIFFEAGRLQIFAWRRIIKNSMSGLAPLEQQMVSYLYLIVAQFP
jgi:hypothetical protein